MKRDTDISALMKPMTREDVTDLIVFRKMKKGIRWPEVAQQVGASKEWTAAACLGQMQMTQKQAEAVGRLFDLPEEAVLLLQTVPYKGSLPSAVPTDPLIYRFYELVSVYGTTFKALIHEEFGDGIMSAIDFDMDIGLACARHVLEGKPVVGFLLRGETIARHDQVEIAHVRILCGEQHAHIAGDTGQDQRVRAQMTEQHIEGRRMKARMLGLEHEIILLIGREQLGDRLAAHVVLQHVLEQRAEIRAPSAEVVVAVDHWNPRLFRAPAQRGGGPRRRQRLRQELVAAVELQVVDPVDQQQRGRAPVRRVAVQVATA
jgi:cyanate lyase